MPTGLEAAADFATGAILGRAVEPVAGERVDDTHETSCLNCGTLLAGPYCVSCGQKAHVHRTLAGFGHDLIHGVFHFDGKIWRTLPMLAWKPGDLTRRYIHGERAKFVSPLALFLFTVFLTFAIFNSILHKAPDINGKVSAQTAEKEYKSDRQDILADIADLQKNKRESMAEKAGDTDWMDTSIARYQADLKRLDENHGKAMHNTDMLARKVALKRTELLTEIFKSESELAAAKRSGQATDAILKQLADKREALKFMDGASNTLPQTNGDKSSSNITFGDATFLGSTTLKDIANRAGENPQLLLYKLQSNAYKFSWALIPISMPFLWLLFFWRRQFKLFDHAVFITYSLCFMMLLSALGAVILNTASEDSAPFVITILALTFVPPIHIYRQIHHAYGTSRFGAFWRTVILSNFALLALTLFAVLVILLGVTG